MNNYRCYHISLLVLLNIGVLVFISGCSSGMKPQFKTTHFVYVFNEAFDKTEAKGVAEALEGNYIRISDDLATKPVNPIEVYLYSSRWSYATTHGHWTSGGNIEGPGKLHFLQHGWDEMDIRKIAVHEFTHAVMLKLLIDNEPRPFVAATFDHKFAAFPVWLYESIAVYESQQFVNPKSLPFITNTRYPSLDELNSRSKGQKIYKVGYSIIEYILQTYGRSKFIDLIKAYGDLKVLDTNAVDFCKNWHDFVKQKYLSQQPV